MSALFEELDYRPTPIGALSLRRRRDPATGEDIFEIKLGDAFLMSSKVTASEIALAELGLAELAQATGDGPCEVVVGGLGLGYTARAVLDTPAVTALVVVEAFEAVVDWHSRGLLPLGTAIAANPRCRMVVADFFERAASDSGFDPQRPGRRFDVVLLDIDHAPGFVLDPAHGGFYRPEGLRRLARHLKPAAVFALWSNEPPDAAFTRILAEVFDDARAAPVTVAIPAQPGAITQTVYLGRTPGGPRAQPAV